MSIRVTFNTTFNNGVRDLGAAAERLAAWQHQVSSTKRVQNPSDNPSASAAVVNELAEMAGLDQFKESTDSVQSRLNVVDTYLSDIISNLTAAQTTAAAGRSTVNTPAQQKALAQQLRGIRDTVLQDFNGKYRGNYMFSGTNSLTVPFAKDAMGVVQAYAGNGNVQSIDIDPSRSAAVTIDGGTVAGNLFQSLDALATAIENGDMAQIDAGVADLNAAFDRLTTTQTSVGLTLGDLDAHRMRLDAAHRASDARRSSLEDANLAEAISRMQQADTAYRAALGAVGASGRLSLMDYLK